MTHVARWVKTALVVVLVFSSYAGTALAADLPLAAASPLTGVAFDDRPLLLPVQRNFQMAMLTSSSELGRSCGKMEAYGWRMSQTEQARVNQIFNNTVDRLRLLGYTVVPQNPSSVANDITLFTADRGDKHFMFLWSAGELGLVMNLCETSAPLPSAYRSAALTPSVQTFPVPDNVVASRLESPVKAGPHEGSDFTPLGQWVGSYTCAQGFTGGSLVIDHLSGRDFTGVFKFYATPRNPGVPSGSYSVNGQYDRETKRVLINPGKWVKRPANYYNTVMVGSFDPVRQTFSAFFQGINGCTSFEAKRAGEPYAERGVTKKHKKPAKKISKKPVATRNLIPVATTPALPPMPPIAPQTPVAVPPAPNNIVPGVEVPSTTPASGTSTPTVPAPASTVPTVPVPSSEKKDLGGITLTAPAIITK